MESEAKTLYDTLELHPNGKICWIVYRCSYEDDAQWTRFMQRLTDWVLCCLSKAEDGELIIDRFEWDIRDNKERFDGASMSVIRCDFNEWVDRTNGTSKVTMNTNCIYVDAEVIQSVLDGPDPKSGAEYINIDATAWVKVLDAWYEEQVYQFDEEEIPDDGERARENSGDEGYEAIDGCRRWNVGWMKVAASNLVSRAYYCLSDGGWYAYYVRPPAVRSG